ncbi:uncharacterized protein G2W53_019570 [Senna tora]|uniref:Uncharacterized protein n=1 Tax=Senna tora TaxID=362788 RepID=A0A834TX76_9FABA|nr:uncharacterized protein G2W53_019570 [Senna tora]
MLGPAKHNVEETVNPKERESMEDTGDMEKLKILETSGSASTLKEVVIGIEATTSSETDSPPLPLTEGQRRHSRSMLGPAKHNVEETVNPKESENMEDTVEMDYAQPHRKPPIHNEKA